MQFTDSLVACISMHDGTTQGTKKSAVIFPCISDNVSSTVKSVIHFECSVQLVARMIQPRYVIHDSLVACILMHERFNLGACLMISCNKLHATIHDQITHGTLFNPFGHFRFRATSCTLRFMISCIKMHATIHDFVQRVTRCGDYS